MRALLKAGDGVKNVVRNGGSGASSDVSTVIERDDPRKKLEKLLSACGFRLVEVFNKEEAQAFLAVRDDRFAVLAFRGSETPLDRCTDLNAKRVPLPGVEGVTVHRGCRECQQFCVRDFCEGGFCVSVHGA